MKAKLGIYLGIQEMKWILNHGFKYGIVLAHFVLLLDIVMASIFSLSALTLGSYLMDLCSLLVTVSCISQIDHVN
jgi:hypothetical protein